MRVLPSSGWERHDDALRAIGERRTTPDAALVASLRELGLVASDDPRTLTSEGEAYFTARFIRGDEEKATEVLLRCLLNYPPAAAIAQMLDGVPGASRATAETVLRSQGFGDGLTDRSIGSLLALMDRAGLIQYNRRQGQIIVMERPSHASEPPSSIFISPETPFGNRLWLRRVLERCAGFLYWLDKHFTTPAFEALWEEADGNRVSDVRVLSLYLADYHSGRKAKKDYKDLVTELSHRRVTLEWRVIDSKEIRATHDRWLIGLDSAWNIPNVNAIYSGQHSELNKSAQADQLRSLFLDYWQQATPVELRWEG